MNQIKVSIEARVSPEAIWRVWEKAHALHAGSAMDPDRKSQDVGLDPLEVVSSLHAGQKATTCSEGRSGFKYQILEVEPGVYFSVLWKSLFVRLIFTHCVIPSPKGAEICYSVQINGVFSGLVRWFLGKKIRGNLAFALKELTRQLER